MSDHHEDINTTAKALTRAALQARERSQCIVSDQDYQRHFNGNGAIELPTWSGDERRVGTHDRRTSTHDRRWDNASGRRYRLSDRRLIHRHGNSQAQTARSKKK